MARPTRLGLNRASGHFHLSSCNLKGGTGKTIPQYGHETKDSGSPLKPLNGDSTIGGICDRSLKGQISNIPHIRRFFWDWNKAKM